jgi:hypothetical protein
MSLTKQDRDEVLAEFLAQCPPRPAPAPDTRKLISEDVDEELRGDRIRQEMRCGELDGYGRIIKEER